EWAALVFEGLMSFCSVFGPAGETILNCRKDVVHSIVDDYKIRPLSIAQLQRNPNVFLRAHVSNFAEVEHPDCLPPFRNLLRKQRRYCFLVTCADSPRRRSAHKPDAQRPFAIRSWHIPRLANSARQNSDRLAPKRTLAILHIRGPIRDQVLIFSKVRYDPG